MHPSQPSGQCWQPPHPIHHPVCRVPARFHGQCLPFLQPNRRHPPQFLRGFSFFLPAVPPCRTRNAPILFPSQIPVCRAEWRVPESDNFAHCQPHIPFCRWGSRRSGVWRYQCPVSCTPMCRRSAAAAFHPVRRPSGRPTQTHRHGDRKPLSPILLPLLIFLRCRFRIRSIFYQNPLRVFGMFHQIPRTPSCSSFPKVSVSLHRPVPISATFPVPV